MIISICHLEPPAHCQEKCMIRAFTPQEGDKPIILCGQSGIGCTYSLPVLVDYNHLTKKRTGLDNTAYPESMQTSAKIERKNHAKL